MCRHRLVIAAMSALLAAGMQARAATLCTAGNPDTTGVAEATPTSAFVNNNNGTVTHNLTGLMWKRCAQGLSGANCTTGAATAIDWSGALAAAVADATAGYSDWRLPNKKELESIVESCGSGPAVNQTMFPATPVSFSFWTGSSFVPNPSNAWGVNFFDGGSFADADKANALYVRLVRGGRLPGAFDANHPLSALDIDGNGIADASDGLLVLRYLFGLRGAALIQGAVGAGAQRTTAADIEAHIQSILPP